MSISSLDGKVAIITGGSKGIGLGIAKAYVKVGVAVVITGRHAEALNVAKAEIEAEAPGARAMALVADGKDPEAPKKVVDQTVKEFGQLDVLINNAQEFHSQILFEDYTWEQIYATYESGIFAYWRYMSAALPYLKHTKGVVINMGSGAGTTSVPKCAAYGSNKEAIRGLSRIVAKEWGLFGINVNVICPYIRSSESDRYEREYPEAHKKFMEAIPLGYLGDAETHVGSLCVYLTKPEGRYITGGCFDVDGGSSIRP